MNQGTPGPAYQLPKQSPFSRGSKHQKHPARGQTLPGFIVKVARFTGAFSLSATLSSLGFWENTTSSSTGTSEFKPEVLEIFSAPALHYQLQPVHRQSFSRAKKLATGLRWDLSETCPPLKSDPEVSGVATVAVLPVRCNPLHPSRQTGISRVPLQRPGPEQRRALSVCPEQHLETTELYSIGVPRWEHCNLRTHLSMPLQPLNQPRDTTKLYHCGCCKQAYHFGRCLKTPLR